MATKQRKPPEVTNVVSSRQVTRQSLAPFSHVELRERQNGSWLVFYPDPGWIPCAPACRLNQVMRTHKHDYEQAWLQTHYTPTSYEDALAWANLLAEGREVKVLPYKTLAERNAEKRTSELTPA